MKDDSLASLALDFNVARFFSISPGGSVRHLQFGADQAFVDDQSWRSALKRLLTEVGSVNVRTFTPDREQGNPFTYGLIDFGEACAVVDEMMAKGYYCIVNETIDTHDGGVSGVIEGGWVEFGPNDTPRVVEKPGACALPIDLGAKVLAAVYGADIELPVQAGRRIEFSIHPESVGIRSERVAVWEAGDSRPAEGATPTVVWPNVFSRFIGDKVFGLLMAWAIGLPVPRTLAIPRHTGPFTFGVPVGTGKRWLRTAPNQSTPGMFTTVPGWVDPFALLAREDPDGTEIASVLYQDGVDAQFSGATYPVDGGHRVEGVTGQGDRFMLGHASPDILEDALQSAIERLLVQAEASLGVRARMEWVKDHDQVWVVQLHEVPVAEFQLISTGEPQSWLHFDPSEGLEELRSLLDRAVRLHAGVELTQSVGWTSHIGDLLRRSGVPARMRADARPPTSGHELHGSSVSDGAGNDTSDEVIDDIL